MFTYLWASRNSKSYPIVQNLLLLLQCCFLFRNLDNSSSVQTKFLSRQFWGAFKLMKNIFNWHGILSDKILLDLGVSSLLNRYLVVALTITADSSDALLKSKFIVSAIPSEWIKSGKFRNGKLPRKLDHVQGHKV